MSRSGNDLRRRLPSVDEVLREEGVRALENVHGRERLAAAPAAAARRRARAGGTRRRARLTETLAGLPVLLARRLDAAAAPSLVPVINATGVVIHTNLGPRPARPRRPPRAWRRSLRRYSNLEFDLAARRARRRARPTPRPGCGALLGAEATVVVNNNAAAVLLAVNTLAEGREVLVSRGELVEIGGSFRIPDVLRKGGRAAARGRHHQPHAPGRLRGRARARDRADPEGAPQQLPHRRASPEAPALRRAGGAGAVGERAAGGGPRQRRCSARCRRAHRGADGGGQPRRRRGPRDLQRRQARSADRRRGWPPGAAPVDAHARATRSTARCAWTR